MTNAKDRADNGHYGTGIVSVDPRYFRPTEVDTLLGDACKARTKLGWAPKVRFACVFLMAHHEVADVGEFVNVGTGRDITIAELAQIVRSVVGFQGSLVFDSPKPDGTPRKVLMFRASLSLDGRREYRWRKDSRAPTRITDRGRRRVGSIAGRATIIICKIPHVTAN